MLLFIDNYDSFTYNLVHYFGETGAEIQVHRNDQITVDEAMALKPEGVVISPGPCNPDAAGISLALVHELAKARIPLFGVCLGHQAIGQAFGGQIIGAKDIMHGKMGAVEHKGTDVFENIPSPFQATRYHSLVIDPEHPPAGFDITARIHGENTIMGIAHQELPIYGVQFHPESIRSEHGHKMINNFMNIVRKNNV